MLVITVLVLALSIVMLGNIVMQVNAETTRSFINLAVINMSAEGWLIACLTTRRVIWVNVYHTSVYLLEKKAGIKSLIQLESMQVSS